MIGLNRRRMMGNVLPYDAEIEFLKTTYYGGQFINTGIVPDNSVFRVEAKIKVERNGQDVGIFECYGNERYYLIDLYSNQIRACNYRGSWNAGKVAQVAFNINTFINVISIIGNGEISLKVDNTTARNSYTEGFTSNTPLLLFNRIPASTDYTAGWVSVAYLKLYKNDELILDFIPVRVGTIGYMYDKVSGQLFGNSGSGSFILGPDK